MSPAIGRNMEASPSTQQNYVNASIPKEKTGYYLFLKVTFWWAGRRFGFNHQGDDRTNKELPPASGRLEQLLLSTTAYVEPNPSIQERGYSGLDWTILLSFNPNQNIQNFCRRSARGKKNQKAPLRSVKSTIPDKLENDTKTPNWTRKTLFWVFWTLLNSFESFQQKFNPP